MNNEKCETRCHATCGSVDLTETCHKRKNLRSEPSALCMRFLDPLEPSCSARLLGTFLRCIRSPSAPSVIEHRGSRPGNDMVPAAVGPSSSRDASCGASPNEPVVLHLGASSCLCAGPCALGHRLRRFSCSYVTEMHRFDASCVKHVSQATRYGSVNRNVAAEQRTDGFTKGRTSAQQRQGSRWAASSLLGLSCTNPI